MQHYLFSLDYLVRVVQRVYHEEIVVKSLFSNNTGANAIFGRLIGAGLLEPCSGRESYYKGKGRYPIQYRLGRPYEDICVGDLYPLLVKLCRHEEHVFRTMSHITVLQLVTTQYAPADFVSSRFSGARVIDMVFSLSADRYTRSDDLMCITSHGSHRRALLGALAKVGVVCAKRGKGYRLSKPLSRIPLESLLLLMYSTSPNKQVYNTLLYLMRHMSVSVMRRSALVT